MGAGTAQRGHLFRKQNISGLRLPEPPPLCSCQHRRCPKVGLIEPHCARERTRGLDTRAYGPLVKYHHGAFATLSPRRVTVAVHHLGSNHPQLEAAARAAIVSTILRSISSVGSRASAFQAERHELPRRMLLHFPSLYR